MSLRDTERACVADYRKYFDTVAILFAIRHLLIKNPEIARFIGVESKLKNQKGNYLRPDLVAVFDNDKKGVLFEIKWSLPVDKRYLEQEIKELKKYFEPLQEWKTSSRSVEFHDVILVCHIDDARRAVETINELSKGSEHDIFKNAGFAVWSWFINPPKSGGQKEELRFLPSYGKTRNELIEKLIQQVGGILIPEEVLTHLRFTYTFIPQKPPPQYTMTVLVQNVFPTFQRGSERGFYEIDADVIYQRMKTFFPSAHEFDAETIQVKRNWIIEAIGRLCDIKLAERTVGAPNKWRVLIPTIRTRRPIQETICNKMAKEALKYGKRRGVGRVRIPKPLPKERPAKQKTLNDFRQD